MKSANLVYKIDGSEGSIGVVGPFTRRGVEQILMPAGSLRGGKQTLNTVEIAF